jgi:type IV pilus assembly protein PilP
VVPGNYVGQNEGRVVAVSDGEVQVEELVPDGIGGFYKRSAAIGLAD